MLAEIGVSKQHIDELVSEIKVDQKEQFDYCAFGERLAIIEIEEKKKEPIETSIAPKKQETSVTSKRWRY